MQCPQHVIEGNGVLQWQKLLIYHYDVIILGKDVDDGLNYLEGVLEHIDQYSFLGFCNYYRQFVKSCSEICSPIYETSSEGPAESLKQAQESIDNNSHTVFLDFQGDLSPRHECLQF